jgi:hypothetical protein
MAVGDSFDEPFGPRAPAVRPGHVGFDPRLVEEDEAVRVEADGLERAELGPLSGDVRPVLFGGDQRLFLNEIFNARRAAWSVPRLTATPSVVRRRSRVRLGVAATAARIASSWRRWNGGLRMSGGRAAISPVAWYRRMNCRNHSALTAYLRPNAANV